MGNSSYDKLRATWKIFPVARIGLRKLVAVVVDQP